MTLHDDRAEFEAHKQKQSIALGKDTKAFDKTVDALFAIDEYDYAYLWSWMGVPIIQMPADIMATQEIIWQTKPDIIIEAGVARGGSVIFMASILSMLGNNGKVIGIDIDIRAHNRDTIETHQMAKHITLIEGGSSEVSTVAKVKSLIPDGARVMVVLDSNHTYDHVLSEIKAYAPMITKDCYLVVADTLLGRLPEGKAPQKRAIVCELGNEPLTALNDYLKINDRFEVDEALNGRLVLSSSPGGYCKCVKA